jgi:hypothetical protein
LLSRHWQLTQQNCERNNKARKMQMANHCHLRFGSFGKRKHAAAVKAAPKNVKPVFG